MHSRPISSIAESFLLTAFDWSLSDPAFGKSLLSAIDAMEDSRRERVLQDAERIIGLADEPGQLALAGVVSDRPKLDSFGSGHDCALWFFVTSPHEFARAEESRYADERRRGRMWDGFAGMPDTPISRDEASVTAFKQAIKERFHCRHVHIDIFERSRRLFDGTASSLVQISIYRDGFPVSDLVINDGGVQKHDRRPVLESVLTYEATSGAVEVVAKDRESRDDLVRFMARDLMGIDLKSNKLPFRKFTLDALMRRCSFQPDAEDGIKSVAVRSLRLMPIDDAAERVTLECSHGAERTVWDMAEERFGSANPLLAGYVCTQAQLTIKFHPKKGSNRGKTMQLVITMPHGCNLKDQTSQEQMIGEKYLRRWQLLQDA